MLKWNPLHDSMTSTWHLDILNAGMSPCQTSKLWSFMHMVHSEDKPQHWTNWHSCTRTGLRPTDQSQNCKQAQHWTMVERMAGRGEGGMSDDLKKKRKGMQVNKQIGECKGSTPQKTNKWISEWIKQRQQNYNSDAEPRLSETGRGRGCSGCRRLQRHGNNRRERESDGDYKTRWSPEQHPARRQRWGRWGIKRRGRKEKKGAKKFTNGKDNSPQPTNTARVQLPHRLAARPSAKIHHHTVTSCWYPLTTFCVDQEVLNQNMSWSQCVGMGFRRRICSKRPG